MNGRARGEELFGNLFEKGEVVAKQGEPGDTMYIIQSGTVEVVRERGQDQVTLAQLGRGEFFGEMALIDASPRTATVRTLSRCRLLPITRESLLRRSGQDPGVFVRLLEVLSLRIERTNRMLALRRKAEGTPFFSPLEKAPSNDSQGAAEKTLVGKAPLREGAVLGMVTAVGKTARMSFGPGDVIFREGDSGGDLYVIASGSVRILLGDGPNSINLAWLGPGEILGEMALLTGRPRSATAVAAEPTELIPVDRESLLDRVRSEPFLALHVLQRMVLRLRRTLSLLSQSEEKVE